MAGNYMEYFRAVPLGFGEASELLRKLIKIFVPEPYLRMFRG
jgi:hypothetical protein